MAYDYEFKKAVLGFVDSNPQFSLRKIAKMFNLNASTLINWKRFGIENKLHTRKNNKKIDMVKLQSYISQHPKQTQKEIAKKFNSNSSTISRAIKRLAINNFL